MPTVFVSGDPHAMLEVQLKAVCSACGAAAAVEGEALVPIADLSLRLLEDLGEIPLPLPDCPKCGSALNATHGVSVYRPDEPELPWLVCETLLEDGETISRYSLREPDRAPETIAVDGEASLAEQWGRPLSVRERLLALLVEVSDLPGGSARAELGPGLSAIALNLGRIPDLSLAEDRLGVNEMMAKHLPTAAGTGIAAPVIVHVSAYRGPGDVQEWAGPYAELMRKGKITLFALADADLVSSRLLAAAASEGAEPDTFHIEELPEGLREQRSALADRLWFRVDGHRFDLEDDSVIWIAAGRGQTLAEAAVLALGTRPARARHLADLLDRVRAALPGVPVTAPTFNTVIIGEEGRASVVNLESLDQRFPDERELIEQVMRVHERFQALQLDCSCGEGWYLGQLRAKDDPLLASGALVVGEVSDVTGRRFSLVATNECPHQIAYLHPPIAEAGRLALPEDLDERLAEGPRRAKLVMVGRLVRDLSGRPVGAILRGDRIASCLAHPSLSGALASALRQRGLSGDLLAQAPTTDALAICRPERELTPLVEAAFLDARREWGEVPGSELGFAMPLADPEPVRGRITIHWSDGANRSERRARRSRH